MRFFLIIFSISFSSAFAGLPPDSIGTKKSHGKIFIVHEIEDAEGWFSIARRYNITYTELRMANKDSADKLVPGRTILVPANRPKASDPFFQKNEMLYVVKEGETLFSIAKKFNTTIDSLRKWNKLTEDLLRTGQQLKIASAASSVQPEKSGPSKIKPDLSQKETPVVTGGKPDKPVAPVNADSTKLVKTATVATSKMPAKKISGKAAPLEKKELSESGIAAWIRDDDVNPNKYYALHRSAPIGTIIKVVNRMNNRYVFVKVVGVLPDTGDNADLLIKISKASAEKLGVFDPRFQCLLKYSIMESR